MTEDFYTLSDCECKAKVYQEDKQVDIEYCPIHSAAPALLAALEAFRRWYLVGDIYLPEVKKLTEQALAQAK